MGLIKVSKDFKVPRSTINSHIKDKNKGAIKNKKVLVSHPSPSPEQEEELVQRILEMENG